MTVALMALPGGVKVGVRDWLSANHIFLEGASGRVIIDTGYLTHAARTLDFVRAAFGEVQLDLIVNTHCHSDHMGCNAFLQRWTHAPIAIPAGEADLIARWDERELWLGYADQICERFTPDRLLNADEVYEWGDLQWRAIATPGHDDGALVFYNAAHRLLISADALWQNGFGFVMPRALDEHALARARAALDAINRLAVDWVIPGHGAPFQNFRAAMDNAYARLAALEADDLRIARSIPKVMFIYALMARGSLALADMPAYVARVGCIRDFNAQFLKMSDDDLAQWMITEAVKTGNARIEGDKLVAVM